MRRVPSRSRCANGVVALAASFTSTQNSRLNFSAVARIACGIPFAALFELVARLWQGDLIAPKEAIFCSCRPTHGTSSAGNGYLISIRHLASNVIEL